ncbi:MAG: VOC family protein [Sandaracinaceae bacterium]
MITGLRFHHLGVACRDLDREAAGWSPLGYRLAGEAFEDPAQGVRGCFLEGPGPRLELLMDLPGSDTVAGWLARGTKIYHQAFEAAAFEPALAALRSRCGARLARAPRPAVAFGGRRVAFLWLDNRALVELIEATASGEASHG